MFKQQLALIELLPVSESRDFKGFLFLLPIEDQMPMIGHSGYNHFIPGGRGTKMIIRSAQQSDLPAIVDIYNQAIQTKQSTGDLEPVAVGDRMAWFQAHPAKKYPIFVAEEKDQVVGWCSFSAYRQGRAAFRHTAEISYYIAFAHHRRGIGTALVEHAMTACPALQIRHLFAIVLENNQASIRLLEKMGFEKWGYLPLVADFDGREVGHLYYGRHV